MWPVALLACAVSMLAGVVLGFCLAESTRRWLNRMFEAGLQ